MVELVAAKLQIHQNYPINYSQVRHGDLVFPFEKTINIIFDSTPLERVFCKVALRKNHFFNKAGVKEEAQ